MRVLLDTHTLIWAVDSPSTLGTDARTALDDKGNELLLSAASIWELAIKIGLGKLRLSLPFLQWMSQAMADLELTVLPINVGYADVLTTLPHFHRDPFDRLIIAQAMVEQVPVISRDPAFDAYPITRLW